MSEINCIVIKNEDESVTVESTGKSEENGHILHLLNQHNLTCHLEVVQDIFNFVPDLTKLTSLKLNSCNLQTLPDCLSDLPLKNLDLSQNNLVVLPNCLIIGLGEIMMLNISENNLSDIDTPPKCCSIICDLNLSRNNIQYLPKWLSESICPNLKQLDLSENLSGPYMYLGMFKNLEKLYVNNTKITSINIIYSIRGLKRLAIGNKSDINLNSINNVVFNNFTSTNTIVELDLSSLGLSSLSNDLNVLVNLEKLIISKNYFYELPNIQNVKLKILDISHNELIEVSDLPENLIELYVSNNILSSLIKLNSLKNLQVLDAYNNYITEPPYEILKNIQAIDLEQNCFSTSCFNDSYEQQKKILRKKMNVARYSGEKLFSDVESSYSYSSSTDNEVDYVNNAVFCENEENWDNYETDDDLFLEPLQVTKFHKRKNNYYDFIFLDPSVFDDALDDDSDVYFK